MTRIARILASAALLSVAAAAPAADRRIDRGEIGLAKILGDRVAGKPLPCVALRDVRSTRIMDGTAIVYEVGSTLFVNRPDGASTLDDDDILVTRTIGSQLCRLDTIGLVSRAGVFQRGFVTLRDFVPYPKVRTK